MDKFFFTITTVLPMTILPQAGQLDWQKRNYVLIAKQLSQAS